MRIINLGMMDAAVFRTPTHLMKPHEVDEHAERPANPMVRKVGPHPSKIWPWCNYVAPATNEDR